MLLQNYLNKQAIKLLPKTQNNYKKVKGKEGEEEGEEEEKS